MLKWGAAPSVMCTALGTKLQVYCLVLCSRHTNLSVRKGSGGWKHSIFVVALIKDEGPRKKKSNTKIEKFIM